MVPKKTGSNLQKELFTKFTKIKACFLFVMFLVVCIAIPGTSIANNNWKTNIALYGWYASIGGDSATGSEIEVDANDLVDSLDFTFMGSIGFQKGKWSFGTDVLYLEVSDDINGVVHGTNTRVEVALQSWVVTPSVGYDVIDNNKGNLTVLGGARYLSMETDVDLIAGGGHRRFSDDGDNWDGIIGVKGNLNLQAKWFIPYYLDIGTGDSDFTWQAFTGVGYHFSKVDFIVGYRYLSWDFDDDSLIDDLNLNGVIAGVKFSF